MPFLSCIHVVAVQYFNFPDFNLSTEAVVIGNDIHTTLMFRVSVVQRGWAKYYFQ